MRKRFILIAALSAVFAVVVLGAVIRKDAANFVPCYIDTDTSLAIPVSASAPLPVTATVSGTTTVSGAVTVTSGTVTVGSATVTRTSTTWTSDASGNYAVDITGINGTLMRVEFIPGTAGNAPTNLYDIALTDTRSVDVLAGLGANLSSSTQSTIVPALTLSDGTNTSLVPYVVAESLSLSVTNAGNTKSGTIVLYTR